MTTINKKWFAKHHLPMRSRQRAEPFCMRGIGTTIRETSNYFILSFPRLKFQPVLNGRNVVVKLTQETAIINDLQANMSLNTDVMRHEHSDINFSDEYP